MTKRAHLLSRYHTDDYVVSLSFIFTNPPEDKNKNKNKIIVTKRIQIGTNLTNLSIFGYLDIISYNHRVMQGSYWYEIRPLHSVRRKPSGRFGLVNLAPRVASGRVCYRRGFARSIAVAAATAAALHVLLTAPAGVLLQCC